MKIAWTLIAAVGAALVIWSVLAWPWATASQNQVLIAAAGFVIGLLGLYASLVGFTIAFQQIRKSIDATGAAERTLNEVKEKLTSLSASGEIERARFALEEAERSIHANRSKDVKYSLSPARQCLLRIVELDLAIFSDLRPNLDAAIVEIGEILDRVDDGDKDYLRSLSGFVRTYNDLTSRMQVRMTRG